MLGGVARAAARAQRSLRHPAPRTAAVRTAAQRALAGTERVALLFEPPARTTARARGARERSLAEDTQLSVPLLDPSSMAAHPCLH